MKLRCVYNRDNDKVFTVGQIYTSEMNDGYWFVVKDNQGNFPIVRLNGFAWKFEIVKEEEEMEEAKLLTGLEAIELMKQGKTVIEVFEEEGFDALIFKIVDGNVCHKLPQEDDSEYEVDWGFDFTINYKEYIESKPLTGWERVDESKEEKFTILSGKGYADLWELNDSDCDKRYEIANYFSTREKAEEIDFKQTLFRKLQRFSDENGGNEIDWNDEDQGKYYIRYNHRDKKFNVDCLWITQDYGAVYFISKEVAEKAIELFHDDLIKYYTM